MSEKPKPALTPEEWAEGEFSERYGDTIVSRGPRGEISLRDTDYYTGASVSVVERTLALAALALHGRITWEMVDHLRGQADRDGEIAYMMGGRGDGQHWADELADLLESLLPPRIDADD